MSKRRSTRIIMLAAMGLGGVARAQVSGTWLGLPGGSWSEPTNWTSDPSYPNSSGQAYFENAAGNIVLDVPITLSTLHFDTVIADRLSGPGTFTLTGPAQIDATKSTTYFESLANPTTPANWYPLDGHNIAASIVGTDGLLKTGNGIVSLFGSNTFTGGVTISGGVLHVINDVGFGDASNGITLNGGMLRSDANLIARPITIGAGGGSLVGNNTTFSGAIGGSGSLVLSGTVSLTSASTYGSKLTVFGSGISDVTLRDGGVLSQTPIDLVGARMILDNTSSPNNNRLADGAAISLISGHLNLIGNGTTAINEVVSTLTLAGGSGTVSVSPGAASTQLTIGELKRTNRATVQLTPGISIVNAASLLVGGGGAAGSTNQSIIPFAIGPSGLFMTHDQNGTRELTYSDFQHFGFDPPPSPTDNVYMTSGFSFDPMTINSLVISDAAPTSNSTITVNSGLVSIQYGSWVTVPLQFGAAEGIIRSSSGSRFAGSIYGSGGLTLADPITLQGTSYYTGQTTLNNGLVLAASVPASGPGPLGSDTSAVVMIGRDAKISGSSSIAFGRDILVKAVAENDRVHGPTLGPNLNISGNIELQQWANVSGTVTIGGAISGPGGLSMLTQGMNATLLGNNSFTGGVDFGGRTLTLGSDTALGTGTLRIGAATTNFNFETRLRSPAGDHIITNPVVLTGPIILQKITLAGPVNLNGTTMSISGRVSGSISNGTLGMSGTLSGNNHQLATYAGNLFIAGNQALGDAPISTNVGLFSTLTLGGGLDIPAHPLNLLYPSSTLRSAGGHNIWNGPVNVTAYDTPIMVDAGSTLSMGSLYGNGSVFLRGPGLLEVQNIRLMEVKPDGGSVKVRPNGTDSGVSNIEAISVWDGGTVDLTNNALVDDYWEGANDPNAVADYFRVRLASGTLTSSMADAAHELVYVTNSTLGLTSFMGQPVDSTTVLIKYAYRGDANLDGVVNVADLSALARAWQTTNISSGADFNYDGLIDIQDLRMLAANWGAGETPALAPVLAPVLTSLGLPPAETPEPAVFAWMAAFTLLARRQRGAKCVACRA